MKRNLSLAATALFMAAAIGCLVPSRAAAPGSDEAAEKGRKLFVRYCASCHGLDAKGQGPVAAALKAGPPDLTMIKAPGEKFPFTRVRIAIGGERDMPAHGTRKMPVWGSEFRRLRGEPDSQLQIYLLTRYLESIQTAK